ncbi:MAG: protein kinase [Labilithrix sp.]|nr:protein kinase [Labilithrix sp.]
MLSLRFPGRDQDGWHWMTELSIQVPTILWMEEELILSRGTAPDPTQVLMITPTTGVGRAWLEHAYALRDNVEPSWAARPRAIVEQPDGRATLLLDDPGGELLARWIERRDGLSTTLRIAIGLVRAVGKLHERGLVHLDIKPSHVLVTPAGEAWLLGLGIAARLPCEIPEAVPPELIPGTLAYMSPEQTGRTNRVIDLRSDLYSVGVTLYEMLTGTLPFTASNPVEWIDRHTAREPAPIVAESGVPAALTAIVMKLLEKNADDRYPSAAALEADLQRCLAELERHGWIEPFELGTFDPAAAAQLDVRTVMEISQAVAGDLVLETLLAQLMARALEHAGATRGVLLLATASGELQAEAEAIAPPAGDRSMRRGGLPAGSLPERVLRFVARTREGVLLDDTATRNSFDDDDYFERGTARSVLCLPLLKHENEKLIGALYLEHQLEPRVFSPARIAVLRVLASLAATSIENARLYAELRRSLDEKDALLEEVHHRVKHNLQLISSLLSLQSARTSDPAVAELFADSRNRIRSMALVHETLYRAGGRARIDMDLHIRKLCAQLADAYLARSPEVELVLDTGAASLPMDQALPCGLIVNELVSNAIKHAFPHGRTGRVRVALREAAPRRYVLTVEDDGIGLPPTFDVGKIDSLGLQLVQDLTNQLRGTLAIEPGPGARFSIAFDEASSERPPRASS